MMITVKYLMIVVIEILMIMIERVRDKDGIIDDNDDSSD